MGRASSVGIEFAIAVAGCALAGHWLDGKLGTAPWLAIGGTILGSIVGFRSLWQVAQRAAEEDEDD